MEPIKDTINSLLKDLEKKKTSISGGSPEGLLKKVLTKRELEHIKFNYFKKGAMGLVVDSSSWLYYFNLQKEAMLKRMQDDLPGLKIIRFRIGEV